VSLKLEKEVCLGLVWCGGSIRCLGFKKWDKLGSGRLGWEECATTQGM
jgi:hypothetical protein